MLQIIKPNTDFAAKLHQRIPTESTGKAQKSLWGLKFPDPAIGKLNRANKNRN